MIKLLPSNPPLFSHSEVGTVVTTRRICTTWRYIETQCRSFAWAQDDVVGVYELLTTPSTFISCHPEPTCAEPVSVILLNSSRFGIGRFISGSKSKQLQKGLGMLTRTSHEILKRACLREAYIANSVELLLLRHRQVQDDGFVWRAI